MRWGYQGLSSGHNGPKKKRGKTYNQIPLDFSWLHVLKNDA